MLYNLNMTTIIGIKLEDRLENAIEFQKIISKYGCYVNTRIGLHQISDSICSSWGIILLEINDNKIVSSIENELLKINKIEIQHMIFN